MNNSKYQEALDRLLNDEYDFPHDFYEEDKATAMERDIDTLQELVDKATWIPVEKKRPPMFVKVLITYEDKYLNPHINVAFVDHHYEWIYPFRSKHTYRVIAWMPLPKPYLGSDKYE